MQFTLSAGISSNLVVAKTGQSCSQARLKVVLLAFAARGTKNISKGSSLRPGFPAPQKAYQPRSLISST